MPAPAPPEAGTIPPKAALPSESSLEDPFELATIQKELGEISFDSGLESVLSEEVTLGEVDSALTDL